MSGLFEHLAATDDSERVAGRQAAAVANKRVKDQLGDFLANATDQADLDSRMSLVADDFQRIAAEVGEEYGVVAERVEQVIRDRYAKLARSDEEDAEEASARDPRPEMNCDKCGKETEDGVSHDDGSRYCFECESESKTASSCCDGCGEEDCECDDERTSSNENMPEWLEDHFEDKEDGDKDEDEDDEDEDDDHKKSYDSSESSEGDDDDAVPFPASKKHKKHKSAEEQKDIEKELANAPSAVGHGTMDGFVEEPNNFLAREAADAPEGSGGAVKREKLPTGNEDALGGPSPKIDKGKAGDEKGHKPSDIDTEYENSPVPEWRIEQDVTTGRGDVEKGTSDYDHSTPELTSDVLTKEELPTANEDGQSTERNIEQPSTDTFPNTGQANPVTAALDGNFEVVPAQPEHAEALGNSANDPWMEGGKTPIENAPIFTVLRDGRPVAMFDDQMHPQGIGDRSGPLDLDTQEVVDRSHPHLYASQDPDRNPIRDIMEELDNDMSAVAEYESKRLGMSKDPEEMTDEERVEAGIPTSHTVDNLCLECGDDLDRADGGGWHEVSGAPYGRPAITVGVHHNCMPNMGGKNNDKPTGTCEGCGLLHQLNTADNGASLCEQCMEDHLWERQQGN